MVVGPPQLTTRQYFPSVPTVGTLWDGTWLVDTGYPYSQVCDSHKAEGKSYFTLPQRLCTEEQIAGGPCDPNSAPSGPCCYHPRHTPICQTHAMSGISGIIGSDFLHRNCIEIGPQSASLCDPNQSCQNAAPIRTQDFANGQHGVPVTFEYNGTKLTETCFLDTGGQMAMMSETLWNQLGQHELSFDSDQEQKVTHTDSHGTVRDDTVLTRQNTPENVAVSLLPTEGPAIDATPSSIHRVPENFNTLYKFRCSIGTEHLSRAAGRSIRVNLPKNEVCVAN